MIAFGANSLQEYLSSHSLRELFIDELGWDQAGGDLALALDGDDYLFAIVAAKRGFVCLSCPVHRTVLANRGLLRQLQRLISRQYHEHIVVYYCDEPAKQVWQWATLREDGKRHRHREHPFFSSQAPTGLLKRLEQLRFSLE